MDANISVRFRRLKLKKVKQEVTKKYPLKRLYKDDIDEIINIFEKNFNDKFDIYIDDYQLYNVKYLENVKTSRIKSFEVTCQTQTGIDWNYLNLTLDKNSARFYLLNDSDTNINGIFFEIDRLISSKKSFIGTIFSHSIIVTVIIFLLQIVNFSLALSVNQHTLLYIVLNRLGIIGGFASIFWVVSAGFLYLFRRSIIYMAHSSTKTNFFSRNGDQVILSLFSAFIGFGLGILASYIVYNITHPK